MKCPGCGNHSAFMANAPDGAGVCVCTACGTASRRVAKLVRRSDVIAMLYARAEEMVDLQRRRALSKTAAKIERGELL